MRAARQCSGDAVGGRRHRPVHRHVQQDVRQLLLYPDEVPLKVQSTALGEPEVDQNVFRHIKHTRLKGQRHLPAVQGLNGDLEMRTDGAGWKLRTARHKGSTCKLDNKCFES